MTSPLQEAFLSHRGHIYGHPVAILARLGGFFEPSWLYAGHHGAILASLGASWGHLGHTWGHLGIHSAIWEIRLHALRLATLSALPVPMLRQVYSSLRAFRRPAFKEEVRGQRRHDPMQPHWSQDGRA